MKYFSKHDPIVGIYLSSGATVKFEPFGSLGLIATSDAFLIREFQAAMAGNRGGITEITAAEYASLKKNSLSKKWSLEAISLKMMRLLLKTGELVSSRAKGVAAAAKAVQRQAEIARPLSISGYRPVGVKR